MESGRQLVIEVTGLVMNLDGSGERAIQAGRFVITVDPEGKASETSRSGEPTTTTPPCARSSRHDAQADARAGRTSQRSSACTWGMGRGAARADRCRLEGSTWSHADRTRRTHTAKY